MAPVVEKVCEPALLGEGPHWDAPSQTLYYVDIDGKKLFKYVPATKTRTAVTLGTYVISRQGTRRLAGRQPGRIGVWQYGLPGRALRERGRKRPTTARQRQ